MVYFSQLVSACPLSSTLNSYIDDMYLNNYIVPWTRAQPYLVGMIFGYLFWRLEGKEVTISWV